MKSKSFILGCVTASLQYWLGTGDTLVLQNLPGVTHAEILRRHGFTAGHLTAFKGPQTSQS